MKVGRKRGGGGANLLSVEASFCGMNQQCRGISRNGFGAGVFSEGCGGDQCGGDWRMMWRGSVRITDRLCQCV